MKLFFALLWCGAILLMIVWNVLRARGEGARILRDVAGRLGLAAGAGRIGSISGDLDGHRVTVVFRLPDGKYGVWIASVTGPEFPDVLLHSVVRSIDKTLSEVPIGSLLRAATQTRLVTGDERFDAEVVVHARAEQATALRDPLTRLLVREAVARGLEIDQRRLTLRCGRDAATIAEDVRLLVQIAKRLEQRPPELAPGQLSVADGAGDGGAVSLAAEKKQTT